MGISRDSDAEELSSDEEEYFSEDEQRRHPLDYDIDTMWEIIQARDFKNWSLGSIHHKWKKIRESDYGRTQISR